MRRIVRLVLGIALAVLLGAASSAGAHDLNLTGIRVLCRAHDTIVTVTTPISRLCRAEGRQAGTMTPAELGGAIRRRLALRFDGRPLPVGKVNVIADARSDMLSWQTTLPASLQSPSVTARLYPEDPNSRTVMIFVRDGQVFQEEILDASQPGMGQSDGPTPLGAVVLRYVLQGTGHIFGGPDHILFVLGLILLGGTLKALLKTVTAFTLAHSVTLTLAATGILSPSPRIVEPLIALSIVAIAVENLRHVRDRAVPLFCGGYETPVSEVQASFGRRKGRAHRALVLPMPGRLSAREGMGIAPAPRSMEDLRPYCAFGFGLIHGFGFAGALAEVGLPRAALGVALASFNIGVEVGQVAIILTALPLLALLTKAWPVASRRLLPAGSVAILLIGAYWFVSRLSPA